MFALRGWGIHLCEVMKAGVVLVLNLNLKKNCLKGCEASEFHHLSLALQVLYSRYSGEDLKAADWVCFATGISIICSIESVLVVRL